MLTTQAMQTVYTNPKTQRTATTVGSLKRCQAPGRASICSLASGLHQPWHQARVGASTSCLALLLLLLLIAQALL